MNPESLTPEERRRLIRENARIDRCIQAMQTFEDRTGIVLDETIDFYELVFHKRLVRIPPSTQEKEPPV